MTDSKLLDLLPAYFREEPLMRSYANAIGKPLDELRSKIGSVYRYFDPWSAPPEWLNGLMERVGHVRNDSLTDVQKRSLIDSALEAWINKGTITGIEAYLKAVAGVSASVSRTNTAAFIAGRSKAGDVCGPGALAWTFDVQVPSASGLTEAEVRSLLTPVVSSLESYTVTFF